MLLAQTRLPLLAWAWHSDPILSAADLYSGVMIVARGTPCISLSVRSRYTHMQ